MKDNARIRLQLGRTRTKGAENGVRKREGGKNDNKTKSAEEGRSKVTNTEGMRRHIPECEG